MEAFATLLISWFIGWLILRSDRDKPKISDEERKRRLEKSRREYLHAKWMARYITKFKP